MLYKCRLKFDMICKVWTRNCFWCTAPVGKWNSCSDSPCFVSITGHFSAKMRTTRQTMTSRLTYTLYTNHNTSISKWATKTRNVCTPKKLHSDWQKRCLINTRDQSEVVNKHWCPKAHANLTDGCHKPHQNTLFYCIWIQSQICNILCP